MKVELIAVGHSEHQTFYHGREQKELEASGVLGIDAWVQAGGIVGRGVLLDWADWAERHGKTLPPFESVGIPFAHLQAIVEEQRIALRPGDILLVRSGFGAAFAALHADEQRALAERPSVDLIGVEPCDEILKWLWENRFAAVAGDAIGFERSPPDGPHADPAVCLHNRLLSMWGMPIGELFDLEELARHCKKLNRHFFFFSSVPLKVCLD